MLLLFECFFKGVWRNGSASDSRSEGWEFASLCPHLAGRAPYFLKWEGGEGREGKEGGEVHCCPPRGKNWLLGLAKRAAHCENKKPMQIGSLHVARPPCHPNSRFPTCCRTAVQARSHAHASMRTHTRARTLERGNVRTYAHTHFPQTQLQAKAVRIIFWGLWV